VYFAYSTFYNHSKFQVHGTYVNVCTYVMYVYVYILIPISMPVVWGYTHISASLAAGYVIILFVLLLVCDKIEVLCDLCI
jgi:hypothetical protein